MRSGTKAGMSDWPEKHKTATVSLLLLIIAAGLIVLLFRQFRADAGLEIILPTPTQASLARIKVDIRGAVASPGVYELRDGDRVEDAVKKAGGPLPDADLDAVNMASRVRDGDQVRIPKLGEPAPARATSSESAKIDINTANQALLESLPRIGEVTARRIIDYRDKNGRFKSIEDLRELKLVTASVFEQIKDQITAGVP